MISNSSFARQNKRISRYRTLAVLAALLVLGGAAALWRAPLQSALIGLAQPLLQARFAAGPPAVSQAALLADRDALYKENIDLKARLGRAVSMQRVLAAVLMRPPATPYDTLTIDAGSKDGVAEGDMVSAGGTVLVGTVSQVAASSARVTLYSAPGEKYDALLSLASGAKLPVTVAGNGGGGLSAQVPAGSAVAAGDQVVLPGIAGGLMARVVGVDTPAGDSFATIYLTLPVNPATLQFVEVWKK